MRYFYSFIPLCLFYAALTLLASDDVPEYGRIAAIDFLMERAIYSDLIAGGDETSG